MSDVSLPVSTMFLDSSKLWLSSVLYITDRLPSSVYFRRLVQSRLDSDSKSGLSDLWHGSVTL